MDIEKILEAQGRSLVELQEQPLEDPNSLKDMNKAVLLLQRAKELSWKLHIVGDFDVDGVMSTTIMYKGLKDFGIKDVSYTIPNRELDGYGVSDRILNNLLAAKYDLVITVDNGSAILGKLHKLEEQGIRVLVTDHHQMPEDADTGLVSAVINPHQKDDTSKFKDICGGLVAYQVIRAVLKDDFDMNRYIQFAAMATICDRMPLVKQNRYIVKKGLDMMHYSENIGLRSLLYGLELITKRITTYHVGYIIGPHINATGRIDDANKCVELFNTDDTARVLQIVGKLKNLNIQRQELTNEAEAAVLSLIKTVNPHRVLGVAIPELHPGVIGIVASRITNRYKIPSVILTSKNGATYFVGSARSVEDYDIYANLSKGAEYLRSFGGHPGAAGMSVEIEQIKPFFRFLTTLMNVPEPKESFSYVYSLKDMTIQDLEDIQQLEPFGEGNPKPKFCDIIRVKELLIWDKVTKIITEDDEVFIAFTASVDAKVLEKIQHLQTGRALEVIYFPKENTYQDEVTIQGIIEDVKIS